MGLTAFGGPAAHIAMMEDEFVSRRRWLSRQHFLDLVGATSLIPGPNSTEMALHTGYERRGWQGLLVAGLSFLLPAVTLTTAFAFFYVRYGSLPQVAALLTGIQPVVLAVIASAVWKLGGKAIQGWPTALIAAAATVAILLGADPVLVLFSGALLGGLLLWQRRKPKAEPKGRAKARFLLPIPLAIAASPESTASLVRLGLFFLKIGAVLYGSGYVLVAFLEDSLVQDLGWLTEQQLLDAIAIGQLTPGPVLSTAAFVGFLVAGLPGAGIAAAAIFLPSFLFVVILNPVVPRLRRSPRAACLLDAVNATAVALMAAVLMQLAGATLTQVWTSSLAVGAAVALVRFRVPAPWLIAVGALAGWIASLFG